MPQFSNASKNKLATCHTDLIIIFGYVIRFYDCTVADGWRSEIAQNNYYHQGLSQVKYPTVHNSRPSFAADVVPYINGNITYDEKQCLHFAAYVKAISDMLWDRGIITHKLRCGADWNSDNNVNDTKFKDPCHFELVPKPGEVLNYQPI